MRSVSSTTERITAAMSALMSSRPRRTAARCSSISCSAGAARVDARAAASAASLLRRRRSVFAASSAEALKPRFIRPTAFFVPSSMLACAARWSSRTRREHSSVRSASRLSCSAASLCAMVASASAWRCTRRCNSCATRVLSATRPPGGTFTERNVSRRSRAWLSRLSSSSRSSTTSFSARSLAAPRKRGSNLLFNASCSLVASPASRRRATRCASAEAEASVSAVRSW
mmetsp:Transcript_42612/g.103452  ORF Transcript_42612/g.103452 Transcript_42612/m.103452 type:complete len:229 (-) Transcript_42612:97-783(-)